MFPDSEYGTQSTYEVIEGNFSVVKVFLLLWDSAQLMPLQQA